MCDILRFQSTMLQRPDTPRPLRSALRVRGRTLSLMSAKENRDVQENALCTPGRRRRSLSLNSPVSRSTERSPANLSRLFQDTLPNCKWLPSTKSDTIDDRASARAETGPGAAVPALPDGDHTAGSSKDSSPNLDTRLILAHHAARQNIDLAAPRCRPATPLPPHRRTCLETVLDGLELLFVWPFDCLAWMLSAASLGDLVLMASSLVCVLCLVQIFVVF